MKMPPIEKIPEAYSAVADHRVSLCKDGAMVRSSDGQKEYSVKWNDKNEYSSTDSASFWQGYPGYPIIAVLMLRHKLPLDYETASQFKGINWHELNKKHKRNYSASMEEVMAQIEESGNSTKNIYDEIQNVYDSLKSLDITVKRKV